MFIPLRYVVDRLRQPRSRADEVLQLRRRFAAEPTAAQAPAAEVAAAKELGILREQLAQAVGAVESCKTCAVGHPKPHGHFPGGHCCGLHTEDAFNDDEVAALRQNGTGPEDLQLPVGDHAGCAFRGPQGCSLRTQDRPNLCLRYLCPDLTREVAARGDLPSISELCQQIEDVYLRFIKLRKQRLEAAENHHILGEPASTSGR
ncbi:MAG TPA: hypothetical protein PLA87_14435 [Pseudomonadota bacterium]|jgi:hypothetical protein|nr:hypothetical protein [Pseudomonadota bacterium]